MTSVNGDFSKVKGDEVIAELAKLRGLNHDDKTENAMLRSRIEEQSELIMVLKNRSDDLATQLKTSERIRQALEEFRQTAQNSIDAEVRKCDMLEMRFNELAENHQELIKFKDQYKHENEKLKAENAKLKADNESLFSGALQEKQVIITDLEKRLEVMKERCDNLEKKSIESYNSMVDNRKVLQDRLEKTESSLNAAKLSLEKQLSETEEKLKDITKKYKNESIRVTEIENENKNNLIKLTKERDELLDLVMQRGKVVEEKVSEIKKLEGRVEEARKRQREAEDKFEREAAAVDANLQVVKLRKELMEAQDHMTDIDKKFEAYKVHTNRLLQQERDLNAKLRQLMS